VETAKLRWRIERDYRELKQELGLGYYEGRGWRGFHYHTNLCIAAYGFLIPERETIPPSAPVKTKNRPEPVFPEGHGPCGSPDPARTARLQLDRHNPRPPDRSNRSQSSALSLLHHDNAQFAKFMTQ